MNALPRPPVSVIIPSRGRPEALSLCLTALGGIAYHPFETVVVACSDGCAAASAHPLGPRTRIVPMNEANVAAARNLGLAHAGGEIFAFLDDDAIPEPFWLDHLVHPLAAGLADLSGGFVTGRNGFDLQWGTRTVDSQALHKRVDSPSAGPFVPELPNGQALRTEGTNMAASRSAMAALAGFDTGYSFYLDDTDLNMRAAAVGLRTASVPRARVWHRQLPSPRRGPDRVPTDLGDIGRSLSRFLDCHAPAEGREEARLHHRARERHRAIEHMVSGTLGPEAVHALLRTFDKGFEDASAGSPDWDGTGAATFLPFRDAPPSRLPEIIRRLGPGLRAHKLHFDSSGAWIRSGGRFGARAHRPSPVFSPEGCAPPGPDAPEGAILRNFSPFLTNNECALMR